MICNQPKNRKKAPKDLAGSQEIRIDSNDELKTSHTDINSELYFQSLQELHDLLRDMGLTKSNAKLLTSRLKERN